MISIEFVVSSYINWRFVVSVKIGQEFRRLGRCNLVVCGFSPDGKIQTYQKIKIDGWKIKKIFGKNFRVYSGTILHFPNGQKREVVNHCGMDWHLKIPGEILEFTEEELLDFDAGAEIDKEFKKIVGNSPNGVRLSIRKMKKIPVEKVLAES